MLLTEKMGQATFKVGQLSLNFLHNLYIEEQSVSDFIYPISSSSMTLTRGRDV